MGGRNRAAALRVVITLMCLPGLVVRFAMERVLGDFEERIPQGIKDDWLSE